MGLREAERCGRDWRGEGGAGGRGKKNAITQGRGEETKHGEDKRRGAGRGRGRAKGWGAGVGVLRRGVEGRWGVAGIVMQIVLGEASVSPERILFLAMIPREPGEETKEGGKQGGKEKGAARGTPGGWLTTVSGTGRQASLIQPPAAATLTSSLR